MWKYVTGNIHCISKTQADITHHRRTQNQRRVILPLVLQSIQQSQSYSLFKQHTPLFTPTGATIDQTEMPHVLGEGPLLFVKWGNWYFILIFPNTCKVAHIEFPPIIHSYRNWKWSFLLLCHCFNSSFYFCLCYFFLRFFLVPQLLLLFQCEFLSERRDIRTVKFYHPIILFQDRNNNYCNYSSREASHHNLEFSLLTKYFCFLLKRWENSLFFFSGRYPVKLQETEFICEIISFRLKSYLLDSLHRRSS